MNDFDPDDPKQAITTGDGRELEGQAVQPATAPLPPPSPRQEQRQPLRPDPQAAQEFLQRLGGDPVLCCIHADNYGCIPFRGADALRDAFRLNAQGYNIYYVVNEVKPGVIKKPSKGEIEIIRAGYGDIDWDRVKFKGHFPQGLAELRITAELLKSMEPPPSMIVHTGGGLQPIWLVEPLPNTPENMQRVEALNRYIERTFQGDAVGEISRILRLAGTVNHPSRAKREAGQTAAVATVVYDNGSIYTLDQLEAAWPSAVPPRNPKDGTPAVAPPDPPLKQSKLVTDDDYDDLGAGLATVEIQKLEYYGMAIAAVPNGPFSRRNKEWTHPATGDSVNHGWLNLLFAASDLADEYPEKEADINAVFDRVCKREGGNTSGNDKQWDWAVGQSMKRRLAGRPVTTMGTLEWIAGIIETLSPQPSPTATGSGATIGSPVPEPPEEPIDDGSPDESAQPAPPLPPPDPPDPETAPIHSGPSEVLTPHRRFADPRPALSVRKIVAVDKNPPPRPWALGGIALYDTATTISSPGGYGKTALAIVLLLEAASGRALIGHKVFLKAQKALFVTQEEAGEEVERRLVAALRHYEIAQQCFGNILFRAFDASRGEKADSDRIELVSLVDKNAVVNKEGITKLEMLINDFHPRIVILDPLNSMLAAGLSDNLVLTKLMLRLRTLHTPSPVAIIIMHHTRKGADLETQDASMGAAAIVNSSRTALNLQRLDNKGAMELGIAPEVAASCFRLNHVKTNYAKPPEDDDIYHQISVILNNGTSDYPNGDSVGVVVKFDRANISSRGGDPQHDLIALRLIHSAPADRLLGMSRRGSNNARNVHTRLLERLRASGAKINRKTVEAELEQIIHGLLSRGLVEETKFKDVGRRNREGLRLTKSGLNLLGAVGDSGEGEK